MCYTQVYTSQVGIPVCIYLSGGYPRVYIPLGCYTWVYTSRVLYLGLYLSGGHPVVNTSQVGIPWLIPLRTVIPWVYTSQDCYTLGLYLPGWLFPSCLYFPGWVFREVLLFSLGYTLGVVHLGVIPVSLLVGS